MTYVANVKACPRLAARQFVAIAAAAMVVTAAVAIFVVAHGYSPTTTSYVLNDSSETVTLDSCADTAVTVAPGATEQIQPFADAAHATCKVYRGDSDLGRPIGCLAPLSSGGKTIARARVRVTALTTCT